MLVFSVCLSASASPANILASGPLHVLFRCAPYPQPTPPSHGRCCFPRDVSPAPTSAFQPEHQPLTLLFQACWDLLSPLLERKLLEGMDGWSPGSRITLIPPAVPTARVLRGVPLPVAGPRAHLPALPLSCRGYPALLEGWGHICTLAGVLSRTQVSGDARGPSTAEPSPDDPGETTSSAFSCLPPPLPDGPRVSPPTHSSPPWYSVCPGTVCAFCPTSAFVPHSGLASCR